MKKRTLAQLVLLFDLILVVSLFWFVHALGNGLWTRLALDLLFALGVAMLVCLLKRTVETRGPAFQHELLRGLP